MSDDKKLISVVVPAYNEEAVLDVFHERMSTLFDTLAAYRCEMIFVNDGSRDGTQTIIDRLCDADPRVAGVNRGLEGLACDVFNQLIHIAGKIGDPILEHSVDYVLADEITHVRMGSRWLNELTRGEPERRRKAIEFQETIDERFNLGGTRQDGQHDLVPISIAKEARKLAGFTDEEIERLIKSTQRSQVY